MHVKLYQALKSVNVSDDAAAEVVDAVEEFLAVKINEATKGLEAKLDATNTRLNAVLFLMGTLTLVIAAAAVAGQIIN
ncbi:hypothetical protein ABVV53_13605 [Novosphingobium sp. RD2P27]|uniref:DUF1640 domain-containing protein n=1 Tax=Novosphingobium kalidii TaxID=3230299 RepID=A0ABV2D5A2_9SPHN